MTRAARHTKPVDTRELILRVALQAFAERGFAGASARDIAAGAGVQHGLIRHYFGSKQQLWQACVDLAFADLEADLEAILAEPSVDARTRVGRVIRSHVQYVARNPAFVRLMYEEGKRRGPRMRWIVDRHVKPLYRTMESLLERGKEEGALTLDIRPVHFFYVLAGAAGVLFHQAEECRRLAGVDPFDPEVVAEHARVVERLFLGPSEPGR